MIRTSHREANNTYKEDGMEGEGRDLGLPLPFPSVTRGEKRGWLCLW